MDDFFLSIPPIAWAALAAMGISGWGLLNRKIMRKEKDYVAAGGLTEISSTVLLAAFILFFGPGLFGNSGFDIAKIAQPGWIAIAISLSCYVVATFLTYKAFQTGEASERAIVTQLQNIWIIALASIFIGEALSAAKIIGAILIIAGTFAAVWRGGRMRLHVEGIRLFAIASILYGTATLADKIALGYFPILLYAIAQFAAPSLVLSAYMGKNAFSRMRAAFNRQGKWVLALAAFSVLPYLFFLFALKSLPASVVAPILNTNVVLSALGGMLLLGEKEGWKEKILGALLAFAGAALISA